jgi:class 3 adenylate cyclase/tetratricopeptide (TPR) repeat protein
VRGSPEAGGDAEARKVLTVVFVDMAGSTVLGQALDAETLRSLMTRYFDEMRAVVERHEGVVAKFIGDAVMAVFGLPRVHEDDALRAVRAAVDMRAALERLNAELAPAWGVTVTARTGVNTGEVIVSGDPADAGILVGDPVNLAARLEQVAEPGEILVGVDTHRLVRDAVAAEPVGPLTLKGMAQPVTAWRLLDVRAGAAGWSRRLDSPLVGRQEELAVLHAAFARTVRERTVTLATVLGPAGVGKSRLIGELLAHAGDRATTLEGRCLAYGEGTTFWPVADVLREAAGIGDRDSPEEAAARLAAIAPAGAGPVHDALAALLSVDAATPGLQETFWAVRKLLEQLAARGPLIVVFDDIHWGQPTFLDLLEYLAERIRAAPVLIVCQARPELLDTRPGWTTGRPSAPLVTLHPLSGAETDGLISNLLGGADIAVEARARIAEVAEGNPLFVEETLRMLIDDGVLLPGDRRWTVAGDLADLAVPPTLHALLAARLDRLEPEERAVIERASVVGRSFWWGAVSALCSDDARSRVATQLQSLMRKELIRPDETDLEQEDAFRFTHILVRDAAYRAIPKATRADMHERLAAWIEERTAGLAGEYDEIVGYHLERARSSLLELGPASDRAEELGRRAAVPLAAAGERAFARGDMPAAANLFSRATAVLPAAAPRQELLPNLAFALMETGDFAGLQQVVGELGEAASATADAALGANATVLGLWIRLFTNPEGWAQVAEREAARAISAFTAAGDERGLARAWSLLGLVGMVQVRFSRAQEAWEQAMLHAHRAGDRRGELESLSWVPLTLWAGPTHADEGLRRCRELLDRAGGDKKAMSSALFSAASFEAGLGHHEEARSLLGRARAMLEEVALSVWIAGPLTQLAGWAELLADEPAAAERELRRGQQTLEEIGEVSWLASVVGILAEAVYVQGRFDEAERLAELGEQSGGPGDLYALVLCRGVRAKVLARRADRAALELAREAEAVVAEADFAHLHWWALMGRADVLRLLGRPSEAAQALRHAERVAEAKGNVVGAGRARRMLHELAAGTPLTTG